MIEEIQIVAPGDNAHASLQVSAEYDRERISRELDEQHAKVWDLVRACYSAEEADLPVMEVSRVAARAGDKWLVALAMDLIQPGWLEHNLRSKEQLSRELPNRRDAVENASDRKLSIGRLSIQEREHTKPNIADILRLARERRIGRPSTYAKHQDRLQDLVKGGLAFYDKDERYSITDRGRDALAILRTQCFADVGVAECEALEADLEAIESGRLSPLEVARKHIGFVKSLPNSAHEEFTIGTSEGFSRESTLPITLDPERSLSPNHRLRRAKTSLWKRLSQGPTTASNRNRSAQRAIVARVAGARLWRLDSNDAMLDELRFNLAFRWICELGPGDAVWDKNVFEKLISDLPQLAAELDDILLRTMR